MQNVNETVPCKGEKMKTYFANSGAEADENAIKIAKAYTGRDNIICFSGAFHGRTNLTMALTAKKAYALGMGPFLPEFIVQNTHICIEHQKDTARKKLSSTILINC